MKKVKMKFDMDQVKQFGIEHGEKFGLALAVLILGVCIVKAVSRETLPDKLSPGTIKTSSATAESNLNRLPAPPAEQDVKKADFVALVGKEPVSLPKGLEIPDMSPPPFRDPIKRIDPTLFKIEELRAVEFSGAIPTVPVAGGVALPPVIRERGPIRAALPGAGGLLQGRVAGRPGNRVAPGAARPPAGAAGGLLAGAAAAPQGPQPFPADFHQPGPPSSGEAKGVHGIVVTGLVPVLVQREEYERRFKHALRAAAEMAAGRRRIGEAQETDAPQYVWCIVERTDVTTGATITLDFGDKEQIGHDYAIPDQALSDATKAEVRKLGLSTATLKKKEAEEKTWSDPGEEVADRAYLMEKWFTWGLPPVLLRVWGAEGAHLPQVPLAPPVAVLGPNGAPVPAPAPGSGQDNGGFDPTGPGAAPGRVYGPMRGRASMMGRMAPGQRPGDAAAEGVPYKLLRFVDLDVEPGHSYKYRVQMLLRNPNFGLEPQVLLKPETATVTYRPTPWSDPSPAIGIPQDTRLLGGSIERVRHQEPKAKIGVFTFDVKQAITLIKEFDTELGALVGTTATDQTVKGVADPVQRAVRDVEGEFRTPSVLLDLRGDDEKLPGTESMTDPAEMLLLDNIDDPANPRLIVVNEAKDKPIIDDWKQLHIPPPPPAATTSEKPGAKQGGGLLTPPGNGGLLPPRNTGRRGAR